MVSNNQTPPGFEDREKSVNVSIYYRIDFMKLTVTYIIDQLERIFDMQSYADASDLITLGEGCKRSVQMMFCQVFDESDDAIYKELKAEENFHKVIKLYKKLHIFFFTDYYLFI